MLKEVLKDSLGKGWGRSSFFVKELIPFSGTGNCGHSVLCSVRHSLSDTPVTDGLITSNFKNIKTAVKMNPALCGFIFFF